MPIGNEPNFGGGGTGSADTPSQIKSKLETLTGADRLDASAIQNLDTGASSLLVKIQEVALGEGLSHGDTFSISGADDFIAQLGVGATFSQVGSRALPLYYSASNNLGFFGGDGDDPTDSNDALLEIIIPKEYFTESQELRVTTHSSSASGTRRIWAYNGDATASGTELVINRGRTTQDKISSPATRFFIIPTGSSDIHLYFSRQVVLDIALPNRSARIGGILNSTRIAASGAIASNVAGISAGGGIGFADADASLLFLGLNAVWRRDQGRIAPNLYAYSNRYGLLTSGRSLDETGSAAISEIIIPAYALQHNQELEILRRSRLSGDTGQGIVVYAGDPTSGGVKLTPIFGTEYTTTGTVSSTIAWNVSTTPNATNTVTDNLHICFKHTSVFSIELNTVTANTANSSHVMELRGGDRPDEFDAISAYTKGERVFYSPDNRTYEALNDVSPDPWDASQWVDVSLLGNATRIGGVETKGTSLQNQIDILRSGASADYPDYDTTTVYNIDDKITEPVNNIHAICLEDGVSGAFDVTKWDELSIEYNAKPTSIRDRLSRLLGDERLPATAIKDLSLTYDATQVVYVTNSGDDSNSGLSQAEPVSTLTRAIAVSHTLPASSDRAIVCLDASVFIENFPIPNGISTYMPLAEVTGNFTAETNSEDVYVMRKLSGNIILGKGSKFSVGETLGNINIASAVDTLAIVEVGNVSIGNIIIPAAADGSLQVKLDIVHSGFNYIDNGASIVVTGWYGSNFLGSGGLSDAPSDGQTYGRKDGDWEQLSAQIGKRTFNPSGGNWINMITFPTLLFGETETQQADITLLIKSTTGDFELYSTVKVAFLRGVDFNGGIQIDGRVSNYPLPRTDAKYRIVRESASTYDVVHIQFLSGLNEIADFTVINNLELPYDSSITFGALDIYTPVSGEEELSVLDVTGWQDEGISHGITQGIECEFVGKPAALGSNLRFMSDRIIHQVGTAKTLESFKHGTLISGSAHANETSATRHYTVDSTPDQIIPDTEFGDLTMVVVKYCDYIRDLHGAANGPALPGMLLADDTKYMTFQVPHLALVVPDVTATLSLGLTTRFAAQGDEGDVEVFDSLGNSLNITEITQPTAKGEYVVLNFDFPKDGYLKVSRSLAGSWVGVVSSSWTLTQLPKDKSNHLVLDVRSNTRALGLPRTIDNGTKTFENGNLRADPLTNRPQTYQSGKWAYLNATAFGVQGSQFAASYYADAGDGDVVAQGWELGDPDDTNRIFIVAGQYGYDQLLNIRDSTTLRPVGIQYVLSTAAEASMYSNGFRWDFGIRIEVGQMVSYIQVSDAYSGTSGRWLITMVRSGNDLTVSPESGGSSIIVIGNAINSFSLRAEPNNTTARFYINGNYAFDVPYQTGTYDGMILHTSGSSGSNDELAWLRDSTMFTLDNLNHTLTRADLDSNINYIVPTINNPINLELPKGTFAAGTSFTVTNGSSKTCTLKPADRDNHIISGKSSYEILANREVTFTQTSFPRGTTWVAQGDKNTSEHSTGNEMQINVSDTGTLASRHGNYLGGITVQKVSTGKYRIIPDDASAHVFQLSNSFVDATPIHSTENYRATAYYASGYPEVNTFDASGTLADCAFSFTLIW